MALRDLNTLGEQLELLACVDRLHSTIWSSEAQVLSLQCQVSLHPAEFELVRSVVGRLEASLEVVNRHLSLSQSGFIEAQSVRDEVRALDDAKEQKSQYLQYILAEVQLRPDDHLSLLRLSREIICYDFDWALHDYFRPLFDGARERTVAFRSASTRQVETHGETLRQSASSIVSFLDRFLSSSAAISNLGVNDFQSDRSGRSIFRLTCCSANRL